MAGLGYNIDGLFADSNAKQNLEAALDKNPPKVLVVLNDIHYAIRLKNRYPNTAVIFRTFWGNEFDNIWRTTTPDQLLQIYSDALRNNLIIYTNNEPAPFPEMYAWELEVSRKILERKGRAVVCNFSVGMPDISDTEFRKGNELWRLLGNNRGKLFLGLHEYWFGHPVLEHTKDGSVNAMNNFNLQPNQKPYVMGRYKWLTNYLDRNAIKHPTIVITEFGWDEVQALHYKIPELPTYSFPYRLPRVFPSLERWANGLNTNAYIREQFRNAWRINYSDSEDVLGVCFFSYGGTGQWNEMSIHHYPDIVNELSKLNFNNKYNLNTTPTNPNIGDYNLMINNSTVKHIEYTGNVNMNFRPRPNLSNTPYFVITKGMRGFIFENVKVTSGTFEFTPALFPDTTGKLVLGWFASNFVGVSWQNI